MVPRPMSWGLHRTESQQRVAARENAIIHLEADGGAKYDDFDLSPDAIIARQIQLSVFLDQSISLNSNSKLQLVVSVDWAVRSGCEAGWFSCFV